MGLFLDDGILPYLDTLMQHLLTSLRSTNHVHSKELAVSAVGAVGECYSVEDPILSSIFFLICLSIVNLRTCLTVWKNFPSTLCVAIGNGGD